MFTISTIDAYPVILVSFWSWSRWRGGGRIANWVITLFMAKLFETLYQKRMTYNFCKRVRPLIYYMCHRHYFSNIVSSWLPFLSIVKCCLADPQWAKGVWGIPETDDDIARWRAYIYYYIVAYQSQHRRKRQKRTLSNPGPKKNVLLVAQRFE